MRPIQALLLAATIIAASAEHEISKRASGGEKRVVCYYTNWSVYRPGTAKFNPQNINPYLCTHLIYAFGGLDRENGLRPYDKYQDIEQGGYAKFTGLKTYNRQLKTMLAIGGWNEGSARFSPLVADEERRKEFVKNVIKFLRQNHFDGLDLDWEYPAYRDGGKPRDKDNYAQLVQELREEFERESSKTGRPRLLLTMAVPAGIEYIDKGYDIPKLNRFLDFMNILSYDYHSAFEPSVNHHSPLYSIEEDNEYNFDSKLTIDATVKHYLMKGADAEKLVLGIPTYGRSYTLFNPDSTDLGSPADGPGEQGEATREKGYLAYYEICNNMKDGWNIVQPKETAMGPYAYKGDQWVGFDDEAIVKRKAVYVNEKNLGGIMFWSIDNDDFRGKCHSRPYPLIEAAKEALIGKGGPSSNNKLPSSTFRGGKTSSKSNKAKATTRTTTTQAPVTPTYTTPEPPTTPDPGSDFKCKDEGFFPHPRDCKKYFWCLDSGPSDLGIVAHQFTCPSGLYFNKAADSCDFARNVLCKKSSKSTTTTTTTTTTTPKTTKSSYGRITLPPKTTSYTTTTTTTTTTEPPIEEEEVEEDEDYKEEDPQTIKQLINLIKKLGGVAELEKQLEGTSGGGVDSTTPAISKSLYERVISSGSPRYQTIQRNGPSGPQNEGLSRERSSFKRDKPQYVTIRRERPSTTTEITEVVYAVEEDVDEGDAEEEEVVTPKYKTISRNRGTSSFANDNERPERPERPKYQPSERFRPKIRNQEETPERSTTLKYTSILRSRAPTSEATATTSKYVVLQRQRTTSQQTDDIGTTENELNDEEEVTEHIIETTARPRLVKVSAIVPTTVSVPTSTRVVTEIVEGATRRQRVPLWKLRQFIKDDLDNSIKETVTQTTTTTTTEEPQTERPLLHGFNRRRPDIVVTSTARTIPAFLSQRRTRFRSTTTEYVESSTRGRFVPSKTRGKINDIDDNENEPTKQESSTSEDESSQTSSTPRNRLTSRNRFNFRRRSTTTENPDKDDLLIRGDSRESNVIRKPVYKPRFPPRRRSSTTTEPLTEPSSSSSSTTTEIPSSSQIIPLTNGIDSNITILDGEILKPIETISTIQWEDVNVITTEYYLPTTHQSFGIENNTPISTTAVPEINSVKENITEDTTTENIPTETSTSALNIESTTINNYEEKTDNYITVPLIHTTEINTNTNTTKNKNIIGRLNHGRKFISRHNIKNNTSVDNSIREFSEPPVKGRKKIVLRRRKPTTEASVTTTTQETTRHKSNRTTVIRRKRPLKNTIDSITEKPKNNTSDKPNKLQRGRVRFNANIQNDEPKSNDESSTHRSNDYLKKRTRTTSTQERNKTNSEENKKNYETSTTKYKRIIIRGRKKYNFNSTEKSEEAKEVNVIKYPNVLIDQTIDSTDNHKGRIIRKNRNKVRKVILKKPIKDLAVEESKSPGKSGSYDNSNINDNTNVQSKRDLDNNFGGGDVFSNSRSNVEPEIQTRHRRPFRKTVIRASTTTTTTEAPTTVKQRTTVQTLRQRLNRFKTERNFPKATSALPKDLVSVNPVESDQPTTLRPVRKEFRRLIKPLHVDDSQLDASHDISKNSPQNEIRSENQKSYRQHQSERVTEGSQVSDFSRNTPQNEIRSEHQKSYRQHQLEQVTESSHVSEEYTDEEPLVLPDLANVAVAAIQSLATSPPTSPQPQIRTSTERHKVAITHKITRPTTVVHRHRSSRPPRPTSATSSLPIRSSPRPFSKVNYDDYEDYYAEPVEVPLSGKVRIHNDGYIECLDIGNFPHPFSCRKFISCAKMENSHLLGWEYTCPKGLSFDPIGGICNWNAGLGCKE